MRTVIPTNSLSFLKFRESQKRRKPDAMLWLLRPRRRDSNVEWRTPGRRFEKLERQGETFSRRWLKLRGINEFCGDAYWIHQRWESYIYGLQMGYKSGTFMLKRFKMGTGRVHRWKNRLRTHTAQLYNSDLFETMMKRTPTHVKRQQFTI